jgi:Arc/MetJ family transcription regulator
MMTLVMPDRRREMRTTLALDDELLADAEFYTGIREKSALVREALKALVEREAARRLARLGGSQPDLKPIPRRRPKPK